MVGSFAVSSLIMSTFRISVLSVMKSMLYSGAQLKDGMYSTVWTVFSKQTLDNASATGIDFPALYFNWK